MPALLTIKQVLRRTGLCRTTLYKLVKEGTFPAPTYPTPTMPRWLTSEVDDWLTDLAAQRARPQAA